MNEWDGDLDSQTLKMCGFTRKGYLGQIVKYVSRDFEGGVVKKPEPDALILILFCHYKCCHPYISGLTWAFYDWDKLISMQIKKVRLLGSECFSLWIF